MQHCIISNPNILDGEPVIVDTRIPVVEILLLLKEGSTLSDIQQMYPHVEIGMFERMLEELALFRYTGRLTAVTERPTPSAPYVQGL